MKRRILILATLIGLLCLLILSAYRLSNEATKTDTDQVAIGDNIQSNSASEIKSNSLLQSGQHTNIHQTPAIAATTTDAVKELSTNDWNFPIAFYGKVIDNNSNAVSGAHIAFSWDVRVMPFRTKPQSSTTTSDTQGLFSLDGVKGTVLDVRVTCPGYYTPRPGVQGFSYDVQNGFSPDPQNPVIFKLKKKGPGASVIQADIPPFPHKLQLHHDGTPVYIDLIKGAQVSDGSGQLKLELWRDLSDENARRFDWKLQLSIEGGGFVPTSEEFAFEAPQTGYQPALLFDMSATNQNWQSQLLNKYYVRLDNGDYGTILFDFTADNGVVLIHSIMNPTGSRNLEPAN